MAETSAQSEPTMEEILASIRRIISEDDAEPAAAAPEPEPEPELDVAAFDDDFGAVDEDLDDDVLDLTERVDSGPVEVPVDPDGDLVAVFGMDDDIEVSDLDPPPVEPPPVQTVAPPPRPPAPKPVVDADLVSEPVASAAAGAFGHLLSSMAITNRRDGSATVEDLVRELLRPMLKDWLDQNLQPIVEAKVQGEIQRIASLMRR